MQYRQFLAQRQYLVVTITWLAITMLVVQWRVGQPQSQITLDALAFYRERSGQPLWQIFSAHFVHLDWPHLWANLIAFIATCVIFAPILTTTRLLVVLLLGAIGAAGAASLLGDAHSFVGFSALTHAMVSFATVAVLFSRPGGQMGNQVVDSQTDSRADSRTDNQKGETSDSQLDIRPAVGWFMLLAIIAKSAAELLPATTYLNWLQQQVAAEAHLGGLVSGALVGLWVFRPRTPQR